MQMLIKSIKNKDYGLLVDHIKINMEHGLTLLHQKNIKNILYHTKMNG
jgi:hypothetical protein